MTAREIKVIQTRLTHRGDGTEDDPHRIVTQYWALNGDLLAEVDPCGSATERGITQGFYRSSQPGFSVSVGGEAT